mgnify:CR=1 FL=1
MKTITTLLLATTIFLTSCKNDINTNTNENAVSFIKESVSNKLNNNDITFSVVEAGMKKDSTYTSFNEVFVKGERNLFRCDVKFNNQSNEWNVIDLRIIKK